ncbi:hypothetical protein [Hyphomicrobium sp. CS1GBMeth3]|uniref:hypothetical protein n=1 Tax=Hyphomicrobium sp. CS1GBMeth3 TaxID=1892845 RepID=UPI0015C562DD|nr:hypothetical protein [Hyphomicrobium sp. CS1GBMeth3]
MTEGAYGLIFLDRKLGRIRKVYRRRQDADQAHCSAVFESERQAFELAARVPEISALVPLYFGQSEAGRIIDRDGKDVTGEVYPCLSFEAEYLPGTFEKIGTIDASERQRVMSLFFSADIKHMTDASVRIANGVVDKVIDFAVREIELEAQPLC